MIDEKVINEIVTSDVDLEGVQLSTDNFRSRCHVMILWHEDETHRRALKSLSKYEYVAIFHNQEGKEHYHVLVRFSFGRYRNTLANELGISANYIHRPISPTAYVLYMCHRGTKYSDKFQYPSSDLFGSLSFWATEIVDSYKFSNVDKINSLVCWINEYYGFLTFNKLWTYAYSVGLGSVVYRNSSFFKTILQDHNFPYPDYESPIKI